MTENTDKTLEYDELSEEMQEELSDGYDPDEEEEPKHE